MFHEVSCHYTSYYFHAAHVFLKRHEKLTYYKGKVEAAVVSETLVLIYQNKTKCHKRENKNINLHRCEKIKASCKSYRKNQYYCK